MLLPAGAFILGGLCVVSFRAAVSFRGCRFSVVLENIAGRGGHGLGRPLAVHDAKSNREPIHAAGLEMDVPALGSVPHIICQGENGTAPGSWFHVADLRAALVKVAALSTIRLRKGVLILPALNRKDAGCLARQSQGVQHSIVDCI